MCLDCIYFFLLPNSKELIGKQALYGLVKDWGKEDWKRIILDFLLKESEMKGRNQLGKSFQICELSWDWLGVIEKSL